MGPTSTKLLFIASLCPQSDRIPRAQAELGLTVVALCCSWPCYISLEPSCFGHVVPSATSCERNAGAMLSFLKNDSILTDCLVYSFAYGCSTCVTRYNRCG